MVNESAHLSPGLLATREAANELLDFVKAMGYGVTRYSINDKGQIELTINCGLRPWPPESTPAIEHPGSPG